MKKRLAWLTIIGLCVQLTLSGSVYAAPEESPQAKELNFVFLHGAGGYSCSLQLLADSIAEQLPSYVAGYEGANPATKISVNTLARCYPNNVDIETWAKNIAESIDEHFQNKKNLILVGHSMGGKAALYAVAHNIGNLADHVALVVTINSPVKNMSRYYLPAGVDYWQAQWLLPSDQGVVNSAANYDSTQDGIWVGSNKHWLAFVSAEAAPQSKQFDVSGVDPLPRNMDDTIIPISAQYSEGADVIYYGEYGHSDFETKGNVARFMAGQILRYIFGGSIECSVFARGGIFEHQAGWLPIANIWQDTVGEVLASGGSVLHKNKSFFKWQEWEDTVGECPSDGERSSYEAGLVDSLPLLTSLVESRWLNADDPSDCQLYLRTKAAPRTSVQVGWSVFQLGLLPEGTRRDHYEIEIVTGTPFTAVQQVSWLSDDPRDLRLQIRSSAEGPFRWFKAEWRTYFKESRERKVIDEIPGEAILETTPASQ